MHFFRSAGLVLLCLAIGSLPLTLSLLAPWMEGTEVHPGVLTALSASLLLAVLVSMCLPAETTSIIPRPVRRPVLPKNPLVDAVSQGR